MRLLPSTWVKVALIIVLCLAVVGGLAGGCAALGNAWNAAWAPLQGRVSGAAPADAALAPGGGAFAAADVDSLDVSWAAGHVTIEVVGDGEDVELVETYVGAGRQPATVAYLDGRTLVVDYGMTGSLWGCASAGKKDLAIRVPPSLAERLDLVVLAAASGEYEIGGIRCDRLLLELASGRVAAHDVAARELDAEVASGTMELGVAVSERAGFDIASGSVEARMGEGAPARVNASLASGSLRLLVPADTGFTAAVDKLSGSFETSFPCTTEGDTHIYGDGAMRVDANLTSGKIVIAEA